MLCGCDWGERKKETWENEGGTEDIYKYPHL